MQYICELSQYTHFWFLFYAGIIPIPIMPNSVSSTLTLKQYTPALGIGYFEQNITSQPLRFLTNLLAASSAKLSLKLVFLKSMEKSKLLVYFCRISILFSSFNSSFMCRSRISQFMFSREDCNAQSIQFNSVSPTCNYFTSDNSSFSLYCNSFTLKLSCFTCESSTQMGMRSREITITTTTIDCFLFFQSCLILWLTIWVCSSLNLMNIWSKSCILLWRYSVTDESGQLWVLVFLGGLSQICESSLVQSQSSLLMLPSNQLQVYYKLRRTHQNYKNYIAINFIQRFKPKTYLSYRVIKVLTGTQRPEYSKCVWRVESCGSYEAGCINPNHWFSADLIESAMFRLQQQQGL